MDWGENAEEQRTTITQNDIHTTRAGLFPGCLPHRSSSIYLILIVLKNIRAEGYEARNLRLLTRFND